jgi:hypothetical protein
LPKKRAASCSAEVQALFELVGGGILQPTAQCRCARWVVEPDGQNGIDAGEFCVQRIERKQEEA